MIKKIILLKLHNKHCVFSDIALKCSRQNDILRFGAKIKR